MKLTQVLLTCLFYVAAQAIASSDDRFIKKYAMMKIYESCFGPEVVKQIRKEMKEAYAKCSAPPPPPPTPSFDESSNSLPSILLGKFPPGFSLDQMQSMPKPTDGADNDLRTGAAQERPHAPVPPKMGMGMTNMAYRPNGQQAGYPAPPQPSLPPYMMPNQFRPYSPAAPFYQFPYNPYFPQQSMPYNNYNPYAYQQYYQQQQQPYYNNNRMSRDMDLQDRLDAITRGGGGGPSASKVKNITCVMQELGYIDHNLEPNYEAITQRISNLPVSSELKGDIQDGLQFCQKFSKCVPDVKRDVAPLSQELIKPMFFFRCYKHKKLEACIMKDIRERFTSEEELDTGDGDFRSLARSARSVRDDPLQDARFEALDEMAVYLYDYLSGGNGFDFDIYM